MLRRRQQDGSRPKPQATEKDSKKDTAGLHDEAPGQCSNFGPTRLPSQQQGVLGPALAGNSMPLVATASALANPSPTAFGNTANGAAPLVAMVAFRCLNGEC